MNYTLDLPDRDVTVSIPHLCDLLILINKT
jgi:hypothetical protein